MLINERKLTPIHFLARGVYVHTLSFHIAFFSLSFSSCHYLKGERVRERERVRVKVSQCGCTRLGTISIRVGSFHSIKVHATDARLNKAFVCARAFRR